MPRPRSVRMLALQNFKRECFKVTSFSEVVCYHASEPVRNFKTECLKFAPPLIFSEGVGRGVLRTPQGGEKRGVAQKCERDGLSQNGQEIIVIYDLHINMIT